MLKKHGILKKLTHPDKGNGVVIMNRKDYGKAMYDTLEGNSKFKTLKIDLALLKEGQLHRFIRTLKKQGVFYENTYQNIYPVGSH